MGEYSDDPAFRAAVEERLGRPFHKVQEQLCTLFSRDWDEVEVFVSTSSSKRERDEVDVIADLIGKAEERPPVQQAMRRAVVRWIGKPWRERENPWDRYKDRVPKRPPPTSGEGDPWEPVRPEED